MPGHLDARRRAPVLVPRKDAAMTWIRACESAQCVEVEHDGYFTYVRSSDAPDKEVMFTPQEWVAFLTGVRNGGFDRPGPADVPTFHSEELWVS
jgi:hypothetical protein